MKITEKAQGILQRLLDAFEKGTIPDALARTVIPALDIPCSQWSLNNRLLAFFADTQDARGMWIDGFKRGLTGGGDEKFVGFDDFDVG